MKNVKSLEIMIAFNKNVCYNEKAVYKYKEKCNRLGPIEEVKT